MSLDMQLPSIAHIADAHIADAEPAKCERRRHSLGTTSHKFLRSEDPVYFASLKKIFDAPEKLNKIVSRSSVDSDAGAAPDLNASFDSLAKQTLDELFGDEDEIEQTGEEKSAKRHSLGATPLTEKTAYDPHATHQLDLHSQLFLNRSSSAFKKGLLRKAESDGAAFVLKHAAASTAASLASSPLAAGASNRCSSPESGGGANWLRALAQRKVKPSILPDAAKPPQGWKPTIKTVFAVLKLRKLHAAKLAKAAPAAALQRQPSGELPTLTATEVATGIPFVDEMRSVDASDLVAEYGELFDPQSADFDVQAFYEECWVAQAASDPERNSFLKGAYNDPPNAQQQPPPPQQQQQQQQPPPMYHSYAVPTPYGYVMLPMAAGGVQQGAGGEMQPMATGGAPQVGMPQQMQQMGQPPLSPPSLPMQGQAVPQMQAMPNGGGAFPYGAFTPQQMGWQGATGQMGAWAQPQGMPQMMPQQMQQAMPQTSAPSSPPMVPMAGAPWSASAPSSPPPPSRGLVAMAQEQEGSRTLQQRLQMMPPAELAAAIMELAPHLSHLATNAFGNYLVSALASLPAAHLALYSALQGHVARLMAHPQGSRVVQAALKKLPRVSASSLVAELQGRVAEVAGGTHGSWSVVCAYEQTHAPFIVRELAADIGRLALQQNGSRVVQRVLAEAASKGLDDLSDPLDALLRLGPARLIETADDKFGNYVVQLGLKHGTPTRVQQLVDCLLPALRKLATSKCGSNVAEVVAERAPTQQLLAFCATVSPAESEQLRAQQYGAYVMAAIDRRVA